MLLVALMLLSTFGVSFGAPLVLAIPLFLFLVVEPRRSLIFAWACLAFLPHLMKQYVGQLAYNVVNEGVVLLLWAAWVARIMLEGRIRGVPPALARVGAVILGVSIISMAVNRVNPAYWVEWVLTYLLPIPVIAVSNTYLHDFTPRRLLRIIIWFLLVQFVLNMTWHFGINPLRNPSMWVDLSCGTYGNTAATAYITLSVMVGGCCFLVAPRLRLGAKLGALVLMLLAGIQFVFTFTIHAYLFLPIAFMVFVFFSARAKVGNPAKVINFLLVCSIAFAAIFPLVYQPRVSHRQNVRRVYSVEYGRNAWRSVWYGPKVNVIRRVIKVAKPLQLAVGMGPNSAVSYTGFMLGSPQTIRLVGEWYYTYSGQLELSTGSIRESLFSGTVMLLSEIGLIGCIVYLVFLVYPMVYIVRRVRYDGETSPEMRFLIVSVVMLLIINVAIGIVWDVWRIRMFSMSIWLLFGRILASEREAVASGETGEAER